MKIRLDEAKDLNLFFQSNYDVCHGRIGIYLHDFEKEFWNKKGRYWFRVCKHCGERERWRSILSDSNIPHYDMDSELKIILRNREEG